MALASKRFASLLDPVATVGDANFAFLLVSTELGLEAMSTLGLRRAARRDTHQQPVVKNELVSEKESKRDADTSGREREQRLDPTTGGRSLEWRGCWSNPDP